MISIINETISHPTETKINNLLIIMKLCNNVFCNCNYHFDTQYLSLGLIPTKTYKRVKKTQKSIVSGQAADSDMVVEEKIVSEIINEDGTKKTVIKKTIHRKK